MGVKQSLLLEVLLGLARLLAFWPPTEGGNSNCLGIIGLGHRMRKREFRRNYWTQNKLRKTSKIQVRSLLKRILDKSFFPFVIP